MKSRQGPLLLALWSLLLAQTAIASAVPGPALGEGHQKKSAITLQEAGDHRIEELVLAMERKCATVIWARTRIPKPGCPGKMNAVAKAGDRVVPILAQQVALQARTLPITDDRAEIMVHLLQRIGTPRAIEALIDLLGDPDVQKSKWPVAEFIQESLRESTRAKIEGSAADQPGRTALAMKWRQWWQARQRSGA